ncbi:asparagine synthase (glutamine-hydrolyzing) [Candidatus Woesearchaeota archaeon]|nr:MAG: asparagine synthase (glutamine-hydrolyzing) [Candidatus Woesearchaeota archaeon]
MCGICGIIQLDKQPVDESRLVQLRDAMLHRGPDDAGIYFDGSVGLGHRRLSIIDLSKAGHQPMANQDRTVFVVFNGEIYNYIELKEELADYPYTSNTDTEVLLAAYERWGEQCVKKFIGMFAFALWDAKKKKLFCARDRIGIKPFYYHASKSAFLFASEIKALLEIGVPRMPNDKIIYDFLALGCYDHSEQTFFKDVLQLMPGHTLTVQKNKITLKQYWDVPVQKESKISEEEAKATLKNLIYDAVKLRLRSDVPLAINLSGGLDSSALLCIANDLLHDRGELNTFTMCYDKKKYDEREFIKAFVKKVRCNPHYILTNPEDIFSSARTVTWYLEQPFGGVPTIAYWKMHQEIRKKGIIVLLEGQGVDETFGGYTYFYGSYFSDLLKQKKFVTLFSELKAYQSMNSLSLKEMVSFFKKVLKANRTMTTQDATSFIKLNCLADDFKKKFSPILQWKEPFSSAFSNRMYTDLKYTKIPRVLRFNDRISMSASTELRVPFLDHRIVEFAFQLPNALKIKHAQTKHLVREAMKGILPEEVRTRQKIAVVTPQQEWFKNELKSELERILSSKSFAERPYFNVAEVQKEFQKYYKSKDLPNSFFLWQWVNLELWMRIYIDPDQETFLKNARAFRKNQQTRVLVKTGADG